MQDRLWGTALQGREILRKKTEERSWKQAWNMFAVLLSAHLVSQRHTHLCPAELLALGRLSVSLQYFFSSCMWGFCCTGDFWGTQALLQQPHGAVDSSRVYLSTFFLNKARPFLKKNKQTNKNTLLLLLYFRPSYAVVCNTTTAKLSQSTENKALHGVSFQRDDLT